jgi:hypothetical protein
MSFEASVMSDDEQSEVDVSTSNDPADNPQATTPRTISLPTSLLQVNTAPMAQISQLSASKKFLLNRR